MVDVRGIVIVALPSILYAVGGLIEAYRKGENVRYAEIIKTLVLSFVTAGLISLEVANALLAIGAALPLTIVIDKLLNAIFRKKEVLYGS